MKPSFNKLVSAFTEAAEFLQDKCENEDWIWVSNLLREYVRARYRLHFTNTLSPAIMDEVIRQRPDLARWIKVKSR